MDNFSFVYNFSQENLKTQNTMAATRERRCNAGNRIAKLLDEEEEEDEFYKTSYGVFIRLFSIFF